MPIFEIDKKRLSNLIRQIRGELSMESFANLIHVTKGTVNNYEKGKIFPSDKVAKRIIEISNTPNMSIDEFFRGYPKEYFSRIFESVPIVLEDIQNEGTIYQSLCKMLENKEIHYKNEKKIIKKTNEINNKLQSDISFLTLWNDYSLEPFTSKIEKNDTFRATILPIFDKHSKEMDKIAIYSDLFETLLIGITTNENIKNTKGIPAVPIRRKSTVNLENYYPDEYISNLSELEKYELESKLNALGASMYKFFDSFEENIHFPLDVLFRDYQIEKEFIHHYLIENGKNPNDKSNLKEYKNIWWE